MKRFTKSLYMLLAVIFCLAVIAGCGTKITYEGKTLADATVGIAYEQDISATAEKAVTYTLKEDSALPAGLSISDNKIVGTPTEATDGAVSFTVVAASDGNTAEAQHKITVKKGAVSYTGGLIKIGVGEQSAATVATAVNATGITYALKEGSVLPEGLSLGADGKITGVCNTLNGDGVNVIVVASAKDCASAEATFTVKITNPALSFKGATLSTGNVGSYYTALVSVETENVSPEFALKDGSTLPSGLEITREGLIHGMPSATANEHKFTLSATANGYESAEAEFVISVRRASESSALSGKVEFGASVEENLPEAYVGATYIRFNLFDASADNGNTVKYSVKEGSELPGWLNLYENGTLYGVPDGKGTHSFTVVAAADNCTSAEKQFVLKVEPRQLVFSSFTATPMTKGMQGEVSLAKAYVPGDGSVKITYAVTGSKPLPEGLTLSADGILSGTPAKVTKRTNFQVTASAEGFTSAKATVYITIMDEIKVLPDGKMEAEYINLDGKSGSGWSGGQTGAGMIQDNVAASNGYYLGWTHIAQSYDFVFTASEAASATLSVCLAWELTGTVTLDGSSFAVYLNGTEIKCPAITLSGGAASDTTSLGAFVVTNIGTVNLVSGENTVTIEVKENKLFNQGGGRTGGPMIDYVQVASSATISWQPYTFNIG